MKETLQKSGLSGMRILGVFLVAALLVLGLTACSNGDSGGSDAAAENSLGTVEMKIDTSAIGGSEKSMEIDLVEGDTILAVLERSEVPFKKDTSAGMGDFITELDGIANGSEGAMSGWLYYLNGDFAELSIDKQEVKDGDIIMWQFSTGEEWS